MFIFCIYDNCICVCMRVCKRVSMTFMCMCVVHLCVVEWLCGELEVCYG